MSRLFELCAAVRDGSARPDDVRELARLAEQAQKKVDAVEAKSDAWAKASARRPWPHLYEHFFTTETAHDPRS